VSARKVSPWDRPELGQWLAEPESFDVLIASSIDRLARSVRDWSALVEWCMARRITVVTVREGQQLDSMYGQLVSTILAAVAQFEADLIGSRIKSAYDYNTKAGRYTGGKTAYGYRPYDADDGHQYLKIDPEQYKIIREVVDRLFNGEKLNRICLDLNERQIPPPYGGNRKGEHGLWHSSNFKKLLKSPTLMGHIRLNGETVKNEHYSPEVRAEPIVTQAEHDRIMHLLPASGRKATYTKSHSLLVQVIFCECGYPMYKRKSGKYQCASASYQRACGNRSVKVDEAEAVVEVMVLQLLGDLPRMVRERQPAIDHSDEIAQLDVRITNLSGGIADAESEGARKALTSKLDDANHRREQLAAIEPEQAGYRYVETGETFLQWWQQADVQTRNRWLRDYNVRLTIGRQKTHLEAPELRGMIEAIYPDLADTVGTYLANNYDQYAEQAAEHFGVDLSEMGVDLQEPLSSIVPNAIARQAEQGSPAATPATNGGIRVNYEPPAGVSIERFPRQTDSDSETG
jgi:site-specific DNA recombinase